MLQLSYRHLKRIARGESKLTSDVKFHITSRVSLSDAYTTDGEFRLGIIEPLEDIVYLKDSSLFSSCNYRQNNPKIYIGCTCDYFQHFSMRFDLEKLCNLLLNKSSIYQRYTFVFGVEMSKILWYYNEHLIWKIEKDFNINMSKYHVSWKYGTKAENIYIKLSKTIIKYIQCYGKQ